jgi:chromosome segregation ATPase
MKTYIVLIKQVKAEIEHKHKEIEQVYRDKVNLEQQIEHLIETLEKEYLEASTHKAFFNPTYFDRVTNKIKAYRYLLNSKNEEIEQLREEIFSLFSRRKKYEVLLESFYQEESRQHQKRQAAQLEDLFRPKL